MRRSELTALGALVGDALGGSVRIVGEVHSAISRRAFAATGIAGAPAEIAHDGIARSVYASVRAALRLAPRAGSAQLARALSDGEPLAQGGRGATLIGALNGAFGDVIATDHRELALDLTVRRDGRDVVPDSIGLAVAYPDATARVAVFVHGLCATEESWRPAAPTGHGARLRAELGYTPVYVRYNSGLSAELNGRRLAEVLDHVVAGWPAPVEDLVLVGHSTGALVVRSARDHGGEWTRLVRHVFCLGEPRLVAPIERLTGLVGAALVAAPETRPLAELVEARSTAIRELRQLNGSASLAGANHYFLTAAAGRPTADLLVRFATGGESRRRFTLRHRLPPGPLPQARLLADPAVYEQMRTCLALTAAAARPALAAGAPERGPARR